MFLVSLLSALAFSNMLFADFYGEISKEGSGITDLRVISLKEAPLCGHTKYTQYGYHQIAGEYHSYKDMLLIKVYPKEHSFLNPSKTEPTVIKLDDGTIIKIRWSE